MGLKCVLSSGWGTYQSSHGKLATYAIFSPPSLSCFRSKQAYAHSLEAESKLPQTSSLPVSTSGPLSSQGGSHSQCGRPGERCPICGSNYSLFREGIHMCMLPFPNYRAQPDHFLSLCTQFCVNISYSLGCTGAFM